jgi:hypothetical protein
VLKDFAAAASSVGHALSTAASLERDLENWRFQAALAENDVQTASAQIGSANDGLRVAAQQRAIASLRSDQASATADFLAKKFTSAELFKWMSAVLGGVYATLLQQATAVARQARAQLVFERHDPTPPPLIQSDYWQAPSANDVVSAGTTADRRGLTGSSRLLQDLTQLDQYAFATDQRKLQISRTFVLSQFAPAELQGLRDTGILRFATPMSEFDRDYPGHYLRLIRRVRVSVIASIPTSQNLNATLSVLGYSRVVVAGDTFQTISIPHAPDSVALTSTQQATGLFDFLPQDPSLLFPFEGLGVDARWELSIPKPANYFDRSTLSDVLFTIEYTALSDAEYKKAVLDALPEKATLERGYVASQEFADAFFALRHAGPAGNPMSFRTMSSDFPPNVSSPTIAHVTVRFVPVGNAAVEVRQVGLTFRPDGRGAGPTVVADTVDGSISTRDANGTSWLPLLGNSSLGEWQLDLPPDALPLFADGGAISDIVFVLTVNVALPRRSS